MSDIERAIRFIEENIEDHPEDRFPIAAADFRRVKALLEKLQQLEAASPWAPVPNPVPRRSLPHERTDSGDRNGTG